jgi:hypothetical protein
MAGKSGQSARKPNNKRDTTRLGKRRESVGSLTTHVQRLDPQRDPFAGGWRGPAKPLDVFDTGLFSSAFRIRSINVLTQHLYVMRRTRISLLFTEVENSLLLKAGFNSSTTEIVNPAAVKP